MKLINKEEFDKLTQEQQRIAIAKDVIERIDRGLISPRTGDLFSEDLVEAWGECKIPLQEFLNKTECAACAKGALVASWIGNFNHYASISDFTYNFEDHRKEDDADDMYPKELIEIFGLEMLGLMELAFEGQGNYWNILGITQVVNRQYADDLEGIMENIIENNGTFVYDPMTHYYNED